MNKVNHWAECLPEVGDTILMRTNGQLHLQETIYRMKNEIREMEAEIKRRDSELEELIKKNWTSSEIQNAKERFYKRNASK